MTCISEKGRRKSKTFLGLKKTSSRHTSLTHHTASPWRRGLRLTHHFAWIVWTTLTLPVLIKGARRRPKREENRGCGCRKKNQISLPNITFHSIRRRWRAGKPIRAGWIPMTHHSPSLRLVARKSRENQVQTNRRSRLGRFGCSRSLLLRAGVALGYGIWLCVCLFVTLPITVMIRCSCKSMAKWHHQTTTPA